MNGWALTAVFAVVGQLLFRSWAFGIALGWGLVLVGAVTLI